MRNIAIATILVGGLSLASVTHAQWAEPMWNKSFPSDFRAGQDDNYYCPALMNQWYNYVKNTCGARASVHTRKFCFDAAYEHVKKGNLCPKARAAALVGEKNEWMNQLNHHGQQSLKDSVVLVRP